VSIDGVTVFGVGLIVGGLGLLAAAAVGIGRYFGGRGRPPPRRSSRPPERRPVGGRLADNRAAGRVLSAPWPPGVRPGPDPRQANTGRMSPRSGEPRSGELRPGEPRPGEPRPGEPRPGERRPADGPPVRRLRPPLPGPPPPVQLSALLAETVQLHPVPAWGAPTPPRNDPPRPEPVPPDLARNNAPWHENTPHRERRHDEDSR
jgi:hypothetical protein